MKKVSYQELKKAQMILRALNHKLRDQILSLINVNGKINVTQIYVKLRLEQSVASQHLAILRKANIVSTTREGKIIWYSVNYETIEKISKYTHQLLKK